MNRIARPWWVMSAALVGCSTPGPNLKTPIPEVIAAPPEDDPRFSQPVQYPKDVLNKLPVKTDPTGKLPSQRPGGPGVPGNSPFGGF